MERVSGALKSPASSNGGTDEVRVATNEHLAGRLMCVRFPYSACGPDPGLLSPRLRQDRTVSGG